MGPQQSAEKDLNPNIFHEPCEHDTFSESVVTLSNNSKRNITRWIPKTTNHVKAIVFFSHGLHEHSLIFDNVAHALTGNSIACFGIDHYAHGLSDGTRGLITDYRILVDDFVAFVQYIRSDKQYDKVPTFILSHSLGTLVTILSLSRLTDITAALFIATAFQSGYASGSLFGIKELYPITQVFQSQDFTFLTSALDPTGAASTILLSETTKDEDNLNKRRHDGRSYHGSIMNKTTYEYLKLADAAKKEVPNVVIPFLAIHGELDQITLPSSSFYLYENSGTDERKRSLLILKDSHHHPLLEVPTISKQCVKKVVNYFVSKAY